MMEEGYTTGFSGSAIIRSLQGQDPPYIYGIIG